LLLLAGRNRGSNKHLKKCQNSTKIKSASLYQIAMLCMYEIREIVRGIASDSPILNPTRFECVAGEKSAKIAENSGSYAATYLNRVGFKIGESDAISRTILRISYIQSIAI